MPDEYLDGVAKLGFDWVYLLGAWQTGDVGREVSRTDPTLRASYAEDLPGFTDADISGSPFAVQAYRLDRSLGEDAALERFRERLHRRGLRLMLDFVPNHIAPDHRFVSEHPDYLLEGSEEDLAREPQNWVRIAGRVVARGRDPYFPGWADTLQLDYRNPSLQEAMREQLLALTDRCDGLRVDMAMLLLPEVFRRTWGDQAPADFWALAVPSLKERHPDFVLVAEVYWDLEWTLQQKGFDFTYDKRLYDRLRDRDAEAVRLHLLAEPAFSKRCVRFLENHDEPRAAQIFPQDVHRAAAVLMFFAPGMAFMHEGQLEGRRRHASIHLRRRAEEAPDRPLARFYRSLLSLAPHRRGPMRVLDASHPTFIAFTRDGLLVVVNYGDSPAEGEVTVDERTRLRLRLDGWGYRVIVMHDTM